MFSGAKIVRDWSGGITILDLFIPQMQKGVFNGNGKCVGMWLVSSDKLW